MKSLDNPFAKLAAVGDKDKMLIFKALGIGVHDCAKLGEVKAKIVELEKLDYNIILITESHAKQMDEFLQGYADKPYPIILAVPDGRSGGWGHAHILQNIERAIGNSKFIE